MLVRQILNIIDQGRSSILLRIGHTSQLGHLYKIKQIPLDLIRSGGVFVFPAKIGGNNEQIKCSTGPAEEDCGGTGMDFRFEKAVRKQHS